MIPQKGQYVKIVFRNGTQMEGIVENWTDQKTVLLSEDGQSTMVIMKTAEDVLAFKVVFNHMSLIEAKKRLAESQDKFRQILKQPIPVEQVEEEGLAPLQIKAKTLAQLKTLMIEQEKKIISEKIREHSANDIRTTNYEQPRFHKMFSAK
jgi:sRNA-binding regulator protein Hfq